MQYQQMEPFKLENKVVVITGAANGIGSAIAKTLHQQGAIIVAVDLDEDSLKKLAADLDHGRRLSRGEQFDQLKPSSTDWSTL